MIHASHKATVAIVGGGIVGLAHAWGAAKHGHDVVLFERGPFAAGASIRNFGMIWPIGLPPGIPYAIALRSRDLWSEMAERSGIWLNRCGSIHLAHREDEWNVLQEFAERAPTIGFQCELLSRSEVLEKSPAAAEKNLQGGLWSPTELGINPVSAIPRMSEWLTSTFPIQIRFSHAVTRVDTGRVFLADGNTWDAEHIVICSGADFETLFPECLAASGLKRCKLQMLKTVPQPEGWRLGPHLASGLTLRHYKNFQICESLATLKKRIALESPELDRLGIHVMASQTDDGGVILGDSHEYDEAISPFDRVEIDELILRELRKVIQIPDWTIAARWHGIYPKCYTAMVFQASPLPGVEIFTGTDGRGMTMAFGLAERYWMERSKSPQI
jgi:D-hydroxyproline dehydrogenase subunit beta